MKIEACELKPGMWGIKVNDQWLTRVFKSKERAEAEIEWLKENDLI